MRLSKTQCEVLKRMAAGARLHFLGGPNARYFLSDNYKNVRYATVSRLMDLGLLEKFKEDWRGHECRLTEKGRAALQNGER